MNGTRNRNNDRKLPCEGCTQKVLVEPEGYVKAPVHGDIPENNATNTDRQVIDYFLKVCVN
jgi:hypothetical protein